MVAYRKSYEKETLCGGWIPWRTCSKTYYNEEYHPVTVPESMNLTDCCNGYEQVGLYCALSLNSSGEFASRPGACPTKEAEALNISCTLDLDCPEHKKCCKTSKGTGCFDPVSEERTVPRYWYDVSVLVKMDFDELRRVDPKLLNHSRLLHSMITGALWPLDVSVYHIHTTQAEPYTETLVSRVLIGLQELVPLANVSSLLKDIVMRVYEVIDIVVQDALAIRNHKIFSVTSSSFEVAWSVNSTRNHSFNIEIYKGKELVQQMETHDTKLDVFNLEAGIMYTVNISAEDCGKKIVSSRKVKTDALVFGLTIRILNYNFTDQLFNTSSIEYQAFSSILMIEIRKSLPSNISALYQMGKLKVQIVSLKAGSIVVRLKIKVEDPLFPKDLSAFEPMISSLFNSSAFLVDQNSSRLEDWNECASRAENDCCTYAECINTLGSYMCRCKTTTDANPSRPGRNCEGCQEMGKCNVRASNIIFSNVTSTSFQVTWTTNVTLNTSFQFLLLNGKEIIQELKTQSHNLTISRLEPGILYTVEIVTEVCGNKSKPVQHKVKTAAQILSGTVRISNLNYSSEFSNTSSEEYQNFTQLFLTEVRTSLPLNILPKMDAGLIKMLITSVTNGSVVVSFNLLIPADMDASNVSSSFLEAFLHSRHFMIDNSSLSLHDYDECEKEETDCSSDASCSNTYGSYECSCKEGFVNANAERPGRNCEGATQTKDLSSTVLPLTDPYTSNHVPSPAGEDSSVPKTRSLENATTSTIFSNASTELILNVQVSSSPPSKPSQGVLIKKAVRVLCEIEKIVITIQKDFLKQESIPESSLYLGRPHCNVSSSNSSHVILRTGWNECGTEVQTNTTHTIVKSVLRNDLFSSRVIRHLKVVSPILCVFQNDLLTSSGYTPEGVYTIFEDLHGSGHFLTEMQLFIGNAPIPRNFTISASDDLMIEVGIQRHDSNLKVVVSECWATPTNNSKDPLSFPFIDDSCPVPNAHTTMISNGISNKAQFKLKIFSFVNDSVVYLHCKIHVCLEIPRSTCKTNCNGFRLMRTGETIAMPKASWGPLRKSGGKPAEEKRGLGAGYTVLIVIGVFAFILAITGLSVFLHQRKTGAYNFKIKSDNFNYQVFYD
ncbi:uromodulin-like 1 [Zootoca vivipara]|uniref:uromodulin-like 1 n=1 Tax=Zootoca vivipara TaxID=8524 RepID=UPI00293BD394|nr:uromodulin-like 1 [Zootoca vivipara]